METTKRCPRCKREFPRTAEYFHRNGKYHDGLHGTCKECRRNRATAYDREIDPERKKKWQREYQLRQRLKILVHYSGAEKPFCACCGEQQYEFLTLDHIGGGGEAHRRTFARSIGVKAANRQVMFDIVRRGYPEGYRVLCWNCNWATAYGRTCPHQTTA